jgi:hypothetical protein
VIANIRCTMRARVATRTWARLAVAGRGGGGPPPPATPRAPVRSAVEPEHTDDADVLISTGDEVEHTDLGGPPRTGDA